MDFFRNLKKDNRFVYYFILLFISSVPLLISNFFLFLKDPPVFPDEPVFFDMAKNISLKGYYTADIYVGTIKAVAEAGLGYPPLYFYALNLWSNIFGSSIESVRSLSFFIGIISLTLFFITVKKIFKYDRIALIGTLLLSLNIHFARATRLGRMEILAFLFLIISSLFLMLAWEKKRKFLYILSGVGSAGAVMSHPLGIMATPIIVFSTFFKEKNLKDKITLSFFTGIPVVIVLLGWLFLQKDRLPAILQTYSLLIANKSGKIPYALVLFQNDFSWWFLFIIDISLISIFIYTFIKIKNDFNTFILIGLFISIFLSLLNVEFGYLIYPQLFLILAILSILQANIGELLRKILYILIWLLLLALINIQFLNNNNLSVTNQGERSVFSTLNHDYHDFAQQINNNLPQDKKINIFIASFPDPYFDLRKNPNFTFYEAPDPNFSLSEENYKKTLDQSDYVMLTWIPHNFLIDYLNKNTETKIVIKQDNGYSGLLIKLVSKDKRI